MTKREPRPGAGQRAQRRRAQRHRQQPDRGERDDQPPTAVGSQGPAEEREEDPAIAVARRGQVAGGRARAERLAGDGVELLAVVPRVPSHDETGHLAGQELDRRTGHAGPHERADVALTHGPGGRPDGSRAAPWPRRRARRRRTDGVPRVTGAGTGVQVATGMRSYRRTPGPGSGVASSKISSKGNVCSCPDAGRVRRVSDKLVIRGAREHNLKNVSLELPRDRLIVFTGLSGSGKSSLAFDTIYAEGQRRYVESLSAYARQFLGQMDKPDVDFIEGLSPAISIDQKSASRNPRSTVGTITEIYDYLRLLYARIGVPHCPKCGSGRHPPDAPADRRPHPRAARGHPVPGARARGAGPQGRVRGPARRAGQAGLRPGPRRRRDRSSSAEREAQRSARYEKHTIEVVVDRLVQRAGIERRLTDSLETALRLAEGVAEVRDRRPRRDGEDASERDAHLQPAPGLPRRAARRFDELAPRNFSFNSPYGACAHCDGLGTRFEVDPELVVPNPDLSIDEGAIAPWAGARGEYFHRVLDRGRRERTGSRRRRRGRSSKKAEQKVLLYGSGTKQVHVQYRNRYGRTRSYHTHYEGVVPYLQRRHTEAESDYAREQIEGYMREVPCPECGGARLKPESLGGHRRRPQHPRGVRPVDRQGGRGAARRSSCPSATA